MDLNILKFLVTLLIISRFTHQITTPEDRCAISESGFVCLDCFARGACLLNKEDGTYTVIFDHMCPSTPSQIYCDDTISDPQNFGSCSILDTDTNCSCSPSTKCIADVNNPSVLIQCEDDMPKSDLPCLFPFLDLNSCSCASFSAEDCILLDDPNDNCTKFFVINGGILISSACPNDSCFNQTACGCVMPPLKCPPDCPFVDDPDDDCGSFFLCSGDELFPGECSATSCFDQASCGCVESKESTTTTEPLTCPSGCPFVDDPTRCQSYFVCGSDGSLTPASCTGSLCFDQESCGCIEITSSSSTTIIPPTPTTCPSGCPFVDNPYDNCTKFYICNEGSLVPHECPGSGLLCFDQEACQCQ